MHVSVIMTCTDNFITYLIYNSMCYLQLFPRDKFCYLFRQMPKFLNIKKSAITYIVNHADEKIHC